MKYLIASDIHGSARWCEELLQAFDHENADMLVLLGDLLYHGPRNDLPDGYDPKKVFVALNERKQKILAVRGNCDSEVDQMVLEFPILADYALLSLGARKVFLTHGHLFNAQTPPALQSGDLLLNGHFHTPVCAELENGAIYLNCGSVSLPKAGTPHSYLILDETSMAFKDLATGEIFSPTQTLPL